MHLESNPVYLDGVPVARHPHRHGRADAPNADEGDAVALEVARRPRGAAQRLWCGLGRGKTRRPTEEAGQAGNTNYQW